MAIISSSLVGMLPGGARPAGGPGPFLCSGQVNSPCANCRPAAIRWPSPPTRKSSRRSAPGGSQYRKSAAGNGGSIHGDHQFLVGGDAPQRAKARRGPRSFFMLGRSEFALRELPRRGNSLVIPTNKKILPAQRAGRISIPEISRGQWRQYPWRSSVPRWWGCSPAGQGPPGTPVLFYARAK